MTKTNDGFAQYLNAKQLKLTRERKAVLQEIFLQAGHLEAEDLWHSLRRKKKRVSRATVYRTLDLLVDSGMIRRVDLGHGHSHYEKASVQAHHEHMVCLECGKVIEFSDKGIEGFLKRLCQKSTFRHTSHCFQVFGYCKECR
jgi:Fur family ferric uptake transcriptional regulator